MERRYDVVFRRDDPVPGSVPAAWEGVPALEVTEYPWDVSGYRPRVEAALFRTPRHLHVRFRAFEPRVLARFTRFQDPVYRDSCVEMFIDPFPDLKRGYVNFETNALGSLLCAIGPDREHRTPLAPEDVRGLGIVSSLKSPVDGPTGADAWTLEYRIPLALFRRLYGRELAGGREGRANFYKCGDDFDPPHYGAWCGPSAPKPDFHRPESFGILIFL